MPSARKTTKAATKRPEAPRTPRPKGTHGGARPGAGHPIKESTIARAEFQAAVEQRLWPHLDRLIGNLLKLSDGVMVQEVDKDGGVDVYATPPDREANKYLLDRLLGKPREQVEHSGDVGATIPPSVEALIAKVWGEKGEAGCDDT